LRHDAVATDRFDLGIRAGVKSVHVHPYCTGIRRPRLVRICAGLPHAGWNGDGLELRELDVIPGRLV
jgi:hypothetical protein